jgi:hypothetical protein
MKEHREREESLREELLDGVTGASGRASSSGNPGPGNFLACPSCQANAQIYSAHLNRRDVLTHAVDQHVSQGLTAAADVALRMAGQQHQWAQETYQAMEDHGHPDFPAALRAQRQNYNPRNSGYHPT